MNSMYIVSIDLFQGVLYNVFKKFKASADPEDKQGSYAKMMTEFNKKFCHDVDLDIDLLLDSNTSGNDGHVGGGKVNKSFVVQVKATEYINTDVLRFLSMSIQLLFE